MHDTSTRRTLIASAIALMGGAVAARTLARSGPPAPSRSASSRASPEASPAAGVMVAIKDYAFDPQIVEIMVGERVTWEQQDLSGHTATAIDDSFGSEVLVRGETFTVTFEQSGTIEYICALHPRMTGTIVVSG